MAYHGHQFNVRRLSYLLFVITFAIPLSMALPHPQLIQKRDILSDIGNFFVNLEMQVNMDIFQPIQSFFTEVASDFENFVVLPAENFFMQATTIVVSALYDIDMFVADIGNAIEKDIIDEVMSVENLAIEVGQEITNDFNTVISDVKNEFDNVITPALNQVGQEIGQGLSTAGGDILQGLEVAGQYIEDHPELIVQIFLTVAITAVSVVQPEFIGLDGALIGDLASTAAADAASEVLGGLAGDVVGDIAPTIFDTGAEEVVMEADMTLFESISQGLDKYASYFDNINKVLNIANDVNSTLDQVASLLPVTAQTISDIQSIINPITNATAEFASVYGNLDQAIGYLNTAGKIVAIVARDDELNARDDQLLEARKKKSSSTSKASTTTSAATTSKAAPTASGTISSQPSLSKTSKVIIPTTTTKTLTSSATPTSTLGAINIPKNVLTQWVQHHFLNSTTASHTYVKMLLKNATKNHLENSNMTSASSLKASIPTVLSTMNMTIPYPPNAADHRRAISHQIATGNATAYNAQNKTVKIQMDANAPKDVCLGVPKSNCFGNQLGNPYCLHQCASRWYNQMNVNPVHYRK